MLYLLDANALITAHNTWYGHKRVPEFWRWLIHHGEAGTIKLPQEIYAEVEAGNDELSSWMHDTVTKKRCCSPRTAIWTRSRWCWRATGTR